MDEKIIIIIARVYRSTLSIVGVCNNGLVCMLALGSLVYPMAKDSSS